MLDVQYGEIRANVIDKITERKEDMVKNLNNLKQIVESLPQYMEGEAGTAYVREFEEVVSRVYGKLNGNLGAFAEQLLSVCAEFEKMDQDMKSQIS